MGGGGGVTGAQAGVERAPGAGAAGRDLGWLAGSGCGAALGPPPPPHTHTYACAPPPCAPTGVQVPQQRLQQVHGWPRHHGGRAGLGRRGLCPPDAQIEAQGVDEGDVVACARGQRVGGRQRQPRAQREGEARGRGAGQPGVHLGAEGGGEQALGGGHKAGGLGDLGQEIHLEGGGEGVGQAHRAREGRQHQVAHLQRAAGWWWARVGGWVREGRWVDRRASTSCTTPPHPSSAPPPAPPPPVRARARAWMHEGGMASQR